MKLKNVICLGSGDDERLPSVARRTAFAAAAGDRGARTAPVSALDAATLRGWRREGVSAVIAENPTVAEALGALLASEGLRVPDDLSAACLEIPQRSGRAAGWSHLVIPKREVGRRTVSVLRAILAEELPLAHHEDIRCSPHHLGTITTIDR